MVVGSGPSITSMSSIIRRSRADTPFMLLRLGFDIEAAVLRFKVGRVWYRPIVSWTKRNSVQNTNGHASRFRHDFSRPADPGRTTLGVVSLYWPRPRPRALPDRR